jgi:hypothetical protein
MTSMPISARKAIRELSVERECPGAIAAVADGHHRPHRVFTPGIAAQNGLRVACGAFEVPLAAKTRDQRCERVKIPAAQMLAHRQYPVVVIRCKQVTAVQIDGLLQRPRPVERALVLGDVIPDVRRRIEPNAPGAGQEQRDAGRRKCLLAMQMAAQIRFRPVLPVVRPEHVRQIGGRLPIFS